MKNILIYLILTTALISSLFADAKERLDNWQARPNWPFGVNDNEISQAYMKDATTTELSEKNLNFVISLGNDFYEDLAIWKEAKKDPNLKKHQNFADFEREVLNFNEARKQINEYMVSDFQIPVSNTYIVTYDDGSTVLVKTAAGKYLKKLSPEFETKLKRYQKQVAPFFGGQKDPMGKLIIEQAERVLIAGENSKRLIDEEHNKQKIEAEKKRQELTKTEKYDPKNVSINYRDKFINKVKSEYGSFKGKNPNDIINISVYKAYETTDYEGGSRNVAECLQNGNNYNEKYIIKGVLLAKENEKYQKYTFTSTRNNLHRLAPISTINGYAGYKEGSINTDFFTVMHLKCEVLPENVAKQYCK